MRVQFSCTCRAYLSLDGAPAVLVDLSSATTKYQQQVWSSGTLTDEAHTIVITYSGLSGAYGTGKVINIDALDVMGELTTPPTPTRYEQDDSHLKYTGAWVPVTEASDSAGSYTKASVTGAKLTIYFTGTSLTWIAKTSASFGQAYLSLDGAPAALVDLSSSTTRYQQAVWTSGTLTSGAHTVVITYANLSGAYGTGKVINVDALDVMGTLTSPTRYEQDDSRLAYQGTWAPTTEAADSGGSYTKANATGARVTITFTGTSLTWIAKTSQSFGQAYLSLDGADPVLVDLSSTVTKYQQAVWSSGNLSDGSHTVVITWANLAGAYGTGKYINLDALEVMGTLTGP
jgi:hypothetical protein